MQESSTNLPSNNDGISIPVYFFMLIAAFWIALAKSFFQYDDATKYLGDFFPELSEEALIASDVGFGILSFVLLVYTFKSSLSFVRSNLQQHNTASLMPPSEETTITVIDSHPSHQVLQISETNDMSNHEQISLLHTLQQEPGLLDKFLKSSKQFFNIFNRLCITSYSVFKPIGISLGIFDLLMRSFNNLAASILASIASFPALTWCEYSYATYRKTGKEASWPVIKAYYHKHRTLGGLLKLILGISSTALISLAYGIFDFALSWQSINTAAQAVDSSYGVLGAGDDTPDVIWRIGSLCIIGLLGVYDGIPIFEKMLSPTLTFLDTLGRCNFSLLLDVLKQSLSLHLLGIIPATLFKSFNASIGAEVMLKDYFPELPNQTAWAIAVYPVVFGYLIGQIFKNLHGIHSANSQGALVESSSYSDEDHSHTSSSSDDENPPSRLCYRC